MNKTAFLLSALLSISALFVGCSDDENPGAGEGEACSISSDCASGLLCRDSVCVVAATSDVGNNTSDMGNNTNNTADMDIPVEDEDFFISYIIEDDLENTSELFLLNTATGEDTRITPEGFSCLRGCWLTEDRSHLIFLQQNMGAEDVYIQTVNADFSLGTESVVASQVTSPRITGNFVSYTKTEGADRVAYYREIPDGPETEIGVVGPAGNNLGSWLIDPHTNTAALYNATLLQLEVRVGEMGTPLGGDPIYTVDASGFGDVGSFFGSNLPSAVSRDGNVLSLLLNAPMDYGSCDNSSECTDPGQVCSNERCWAQQLVLIFIDLQNTDLIDDPCSGDAACGPIMTCDIPSMTQLDKAKCIPRRAVLGLPGQLSQGDPARTGCDLTAGDLNAYTNIQPPLSYGASGDLYVTASRDCADFNIPKSDVLAVNPTTGAKTIVYGKAGDFDDALCYDEDEEAIDTENCVVYIDEAIASPGGNTISFAATNPNVVDFNLADDTYDIWTVLRDGSNYKWIGDHSEFKNVTSIRVHE